MTPTGPRPCLVSSSRDAFRERGAYEQPLHRIHLQIRKVALRMGEGHANLFAEPVRGTSDRTIDWYAPIDGDVVPYVRLGAERRQWFDRELARRRSDLQQLAGELAARNSEDDRKFARVLEWSLSYPGTEQLFLVGEQPVMTFWGFEPADGRAALDGTGQASGPRAGHEAPGIDGSDAATTKPSSQIAAARARRWRAWLWPLLGILGLGLVWLLQPGWMHGCVRLPPQPSSLGEWLSRWSAREQPVGAARDPGQGITGILGADAVRRGVVATGGVPSDGAPRATDVAATPSAGAGHDAGTGSPASGDAGSATPGSAEVGAEPTGDGGDVPPSKDSAGTPPAGQAAARPDDSPVSDDLKLPRAPSEQPSFEFLRGRWRTVTNLYGGQGEDAVPVTVEYDFDGSGRGKTTVRQTRGGECTSEARAEFDPSGALRVRDTSPPACADGSRYVPTELRCTVGDDGKARCQGVQENGHRFRAQMQRSGD